MYSVHVSCSFGKSKVEIFLFLRFDNRRPGLWKAKFMRYILFILVTFIRFVYFVRIDAYTNIPDLENNQPGAWELATANLGHPGLAIHAMWRSGGQERRVEKFEFQDTSVRTGPTPFPTTCKVNCSEFCKTALDNFES